jgi:fibronectin-binding autotransporter adhesin
MGRRHIARGGSSQTSQKHSESRRRILLAVAGVSLLGIVAATAPATENYTEVNDAVTSNWAAKTFTAGDPAVNGDGLLTAGGGTLNIVSPESAGNILFGWGGVYNGNIFAGGSLTIASTANVNDGFNVLSIGEHNNSTFTQSGGTVTVPTLDLDRSNGNSGSIYNLNGGLLSLGSGGVVEAGSSTFNLNGGTILLNTSSGGTFNGAGTLTFALGANGGTLSAVGDDTIQAHITDGSGGSGSTGLHTTGVIRFGASNTYLGDTYIDSGYIVTNVNNALPSTTVVHLTSSTSHLDVDGSTETVSGLVGVSGALIYNDNGTGNLTDNVAGGNLFTYNGTTNTSFNLFKQGGGTQVFGIAPNSGRLTINAGTVVINGTSTVAGAITDNANLAVINTANSNVTSLISGTGNVSLSAGLTGMFYSIQASNTYSGTTTINMGSGAIYLDNGFAGSGNSASPNSVFDVLSGTIYQRDTVETVAGLAGTGVWSGEAAHGAAAKTLTISFASGSQSYAGQLKNGTSTTLALVKNGAGTQVLTGANSYTGGTTVNGGILEAATPASLPGYNSANVVAVGSSGTIAVNYGGPSDWTQNQILGLLGQANLSAGAAIGFDTTNGSGTYSSVVQNNITPGITKLGANTLTLNFSGLASGQLTVQGGTLQLGDGANGSLSTVSPLTFNGTGTFNLEEADQSAQTLGALAFGAGDGTVQSTTGGTGASLTFSSLTTRTAGATGNFVLSGAGTNSISITGQAVGFIDQGTFFGGSNYAYNDAGGFVRGVNYAADPGTATTSGGSALPTTDSFSNPATVVQMTGSVSAQPTATYAALNISGGNTLTLGGSQTLTINGILQSGGAAGTVTGGSGIQAASGAELVVRTDQPGDSLTISTPILDNGTTALTKSGAGTLILSASNSYAGVTTINSGTLQIGPGGTFGTGAVLNNAAINFARSDSSTVANAISGTGSVTQSGAGTTILTGANTYTGTTSIASGGTLQIGAGSSAGTLGTGAITDAGTLNFNRSDALYVSNAISGAGALVQAGTGRTILTSANSYSGGTTISAGGLELNGLGSINGTVVDNGNLALTPSNPAQIGAGEALSAVSGSGGVTLASTMINAFVGLQGGFSYTGTTTINMDGGGVGTNVYLQSAGFQNGTGVNDIPAASLVVLNAGNVQQRTPSQTIAGLSGSTGANWNADNGTSITAHTLNINLASGTQTYAGAFNDAASDTLTVVKSGAGTEVFSGASTFQGGLTVSAGTLRLAGTSGSATGTAPVSVSGGATLAGTGSITSNITLAAGATLESGGVLAPGSGTDAGVVSNIGKLTTSASETWNGGAVYSWKLNTPGTAGAVATSNTGAGTAWDDVVMSNLTVASVPSVGGTAAFTVALSGGIANVTSSTTYSWTIGEISGTVTGEPSDSSNLLASGDFVLDTSKFYVNGIAAPSQSAFSLDFATLGGGGEQLQLNYNGTPEPGTTLLALSGAVPMLLARRRKRVASV